MKTKISNIAFFLGCAAVYSCIAAVIFLTHHNPGFWFQADNTWAPHFIFDTLVKHHSASSWMLANGTIHLLDTVPFVIFSFFSHNMTHWIYWNAIFNLSFYFCCFFTLANLVTNKKRSAFIMMLSCFFSLALIANFIQIDFTIDLVLISAEHMTQLLLGWLCLSIIIKLLKTPVSKPAIFAIVILVTIGVLSDELLLISFIGPILISLLLFYLLSNDNCSNILKLIIYIVIATIIGRLLWTFFPLHYQRVSVVMDNNLFHTAYALGIYLFTIFQNHPLYIILNLLSVGLSTLVIIAAVKEKKFSSKKTLAHERAQLFVLIFCCCTWLVGLAGLFVNYHLIKFLFDYKVAHLISHFHYVALTRDGIAFLVTPVFIGIPTLIIYISQQFFTVSHRCLLPWISALGSLIIASLTAYAALNNKKQPTALHSQQGIMQCLASNIKKHHLHTGIADYWIYRPIIIMSNGKIAMTPIYSGPRDQYEHYLSTWDEINHKQIDYWIDKYNVFFKDPDYANYYDVKDDIAFKLSKFGKPTSEFSCKGSHGQYLHAYIYKNNGIMKDLIPSIHLYGLTHAFINKQNQIQLK